MVYSGKVCKKPVIRRTKRDDGSSLIVKQGISDKRNEVELPRGREMTSRNYGARFMSGEDHR